MKGLRAVRCVIKYNIYSKANSYKSAVVQISIKKIRKNPPYKDTRREKIISCRIWI